MWAGIHRTNHLVEGINVSSTEVHGTKLFHDMIAANSDEFFTAELMREVWSVTPYMVDCDTGQIGGSVIGG